MEIPSIPFYEYSPIIKREPLKWPEGARIAVLITVNIESWDLLPRRYGGPQILGSEVLSPDTPDVPNFTWREYGLRVGIFRIMEMLDRLALKASVTLNSIIGERYPVIVEEGKKRGWEFIAHSYRQDELIAELHDDIEAEKKVIRRALDTFKKVVGEPAKGWLSTGERSTMNTPKILLDEGLEHFSDYQNDDQPYPLKIDGRTLISIPYSSELNDYRCIRGNLSHTDFHDIIRDEFDVLYREGAENGRMMNIGLHTQVSGRAHRIHTLEKVLNYIKGHQGVWFPSRSEIASWYRKNYLR